MEGGELAIGWSNTVSIILAHAKGFDFAFLAPGAEGVAGTVERFVELMNEVWRVLRPGGTFVACTPALPLPETHKDFP